MTKSKRRAKRLEHCHDLSRFLDSVHYKWNQGYLGFTRRWASNIFNVDLSTPCSGADFRTTTTTGKRLSHVITLHESEQARSSAACLYPYEGFVDAEQSDQYVPIVVRGQTRLYLHHIAIK
jgi:hypothetical protein